MTHLMIPFSGFVNSLSRRNQSLTPGMDNLYRSSFLGLTVALICALALMLVFSVFVWNARNGLIFLLLQLFLMDLKFIFFLRLRFFWYFHNNNKSSKNWKKILSYVWDRCTTPILYAVDVWSSWSLWTLLWICETDLWLLRFTYRILSEKQDWLLLA